MTDVKVTRENMVEAAGALDLDPGSIRLVSESHERLPRGSRLHLVAEAIAAAEARGEAKLRAELEEARRSLADRIVTDASRQQQLADGWKRLRDEKRAIRAGAWDKGYDVALTDMGYEPSEAPVVSDTPNPYREDPCRPLPAPPTEGEER